MSGSIRVLLVALALLAGCRSGIALAIETVTWAWSDFPPAQILHGPSANQGYSQLSVRWFGERMPQYRFEDSEVPLGRLLADAHDGKPLCAPDLLKTPQRLEYLTFSAPYLVLAPLRLGVVKQRSAEVRALENADGLIDISRLATLDPPINLTLLRDRSFGRDIDKALKTVPHRRVVEPENGIELLRTRHAEATIAYSEEFVWRDESDGATTDYATFGMVGTEPTPASFACTKGKWGDAVIAEINRLIPTAPPGLFDDYYRRWLDPDTLRYLTQHR